MRLSDSRVRMRICMVSTYSDTPSSSAVASTLLSSWSPLNGRGTSASMGRMSVSLPPKIECVLLSSPISELIS